VFRGPWVGLRGGDGSEDGEMREGVKGWRREEVNGRGRKD